MSSHKMFTTIVMDVTAPESLDINNYIFLLSMATINVYEMTG